MESDCGERNVVLRVLRILIPNYIVIVLIDSPERSSCAKSSNRSISPTGLIIRLQNYDFPHTMMYNYRAKSDSIRAKQHQSTHFITANQIKDNVP